MNPALEEARQRWKAMRAAWGVTYTKAPQVPTDTTALPGDRTMSPMTPGFDDASGWNLANTPVWDPGTAMGAEDDSVVDVVLDTVVPSTPLDVAGMAGGAAMLRGAGKAAKVNPGRVTHTRELANRISAKPPSPNLNKRPTYGMPDRMYPQGGPKPYGTPPPRGAYPQKAVSRRPSDVQSQAAPPRTPPQNSPANGPTWEDIRNLEAETRTPQEYIETLMSRYGAQGKQPPAPPFLKNPASDPRFMRPAESAQRWQKPTTRSVRSQDSNIGPVFAPNDNGAYSDEEEYLDTYKARPLTNIPNPDELTPEEEMDYVNSLKALGTMRR